jgi:hypothetical protein
VQRGLRVRRQHPRRDGPRVRAECRPLAALAAAAVVVPVSARAAAAAPAAIPAPAARRPVRRGNRLGFLDYPRCAGLTHAASSAAFRVVRPVVWTARPYEFASISASFSR